LATAPQSLAAHSASRQAAGTTGATEEVSIAAPWPGLKGPAMGNHGARTIFVSWRRERLRVGSGGTQADSPGQQAPGSPATKREGAKR